MGNHLNARCRAVSRFQQGLIHSSRHKSWRESSDALLASGRCEPAGLPTQPRRGFPTRGAFQGLPPLATRCRRSAAEEGPAEPSAMCPRRMILPLRQPQAENEARRPHGFPLETKPHTEFSSGEPTFRQASSTALLEFSRHGVDLTRSAQRMEMGRKPVRTRSRQTQTALSDFRLPPRRVPRLPATCRNRRGPHGVRH
jgi:hypothetical protein